MSFDILADEFENVARVAVAILQPFIVWYLARIVSSIDKLAEQIRVQNGRMIQLETWRDNHDRWARDESARVQKCLDAWNDRA